MNQTSASQSYKPLIGVTAERKFAHDYYWHQVEEHYLTATVDAIGGVPVIIPALANRLDIPALLHHLDGLLLTGGASNIEPHFYGRASEQDDCGRDPERDATTLALIPAAIAMGLPVFGICRGLQEMNVALGGTLHQRVHVVPGKNDHREDESQPVEQQYAPVHAVALQPGGVLVGLAAAREVMVNSVHGQGIDQLAPGLRIEALAPDGLIEAISVPSAASFACAVQWHPEWYRQDTPFWRELLAAFGADCRRYAAARHAHNG
ncbi:MAG: puuD [Verrucomicrobiaceae bacterium]|nr:puuD [Verrucomicrobiaceae bacterium]